MNVIPKFEHSFVSLFTVNKQSAEVISPVPWSVGFTYSIMSDVRLVIESTAPNQPSNQALFSYGKYYTTE